MIHKDIRHLDRIAWRIEGDLKCPPKDKKILLDNLEACNAILRRLAKKARDEKSKEA